MKKVNTDNLLRLAASSIICQLAGFIGSFFTRSSVSTWYVTLNKPTFNPPNGVFGPVWITLFVLMASSMFLVWQRATRGIDTSGALTAFGLQLFLNILWSALFFGLRSPLAGLVDIIILWAAILITIVLFLRISKAAGILLIPYILWVSFAAILNSAILALNR
jgi:benzodiazapine receptor